jgi:hypothetical protein
MSITTSLILRLSRAQSVWNAAVLAFALVWTRLPPSYNEFARRLWKRAGSRRSSGTPPHLGRPGSNVAATPSDDTAWFTSARKCTSSGDSVTSSITGMAFAFAARRVTGRGRGVQRCNTPVDADFVRDCMTARTVKDFSKHQNFITKVIFQAAC